jgi:hypothetical protein
MARPILIALAALVPLFASAADDRIQWGKPVNGLRIGIASFVSTVGPIERPKFKIIAENVSKQAMSIPGADSLVPEKDFGAGDSSDDREVALRFCSNQNYDHAIPTLLTMGGDPDPTVPPVRIRSSKSGLRKVSEDSSEWKASQSLSACSAIRHIAARTEPRCTYLAV